MAAANGELYFSASSKRTSAVLVVAAPCALALPKGPGGAGEQPSLLPIAATLSSSLRN